MTTAIVTGQGVRLHETPALAGAVIGSLDKGVRVEAFESQGGWTRVALQLDGHERRGWISDTFLQAGAAAAQPASPAPAAAAGLGPSFNIPVFLGRAAQMPGYDGQLTEAQEAGCGAILLACAGLPLCWTAYVLATAAHETGRSFDTGKQENLNYSPQGLMGTFSRKRISEADCKALGRAAGRPAQQRAIANKIYGGAWGRSNLGNTEPDDGWTYRGRGWVQITGRANYRRADERLGLGGGLVADPDRVRELPICAAITVRGMQEGWFTGETLSDHLPSAGSATQAQFTASRPIINQDKGPEIAVIAMGFQAALTAAGWKPA